MNANLDLPITKRRGRRALFLIGGGLLKLLRGSVFLFMMPVFGLALLIGIILVVVLASLTAAILFMDHEHDPECATVFHLELNKRGEDERVGLGEHQRLSELRDNTA
jgi:hypothetical protein